MRVSIRVGHGYPVIAAFAIGADMADARERQMRYRDEVAVRGERGERLFADQGGTFVILVIGDGHVRVGKLNRRDVDRVADENDVLALAGQRVESGSRRMTGISLSLRLRAA